jgi:parallel beta-helix repeat protein
LGTFLFVLFCTASYGASYYVSSINGNDNNAGTSSSAPWKSIERLKRVLSSLQVGDKVYLEKGSEWDNVSLRLSNLTGTSLNPIVFTTYGTGSQPRIKGSKVISSFTQNGNIWRKVDNSLPDYKATSRRVIPFVYINNKRYEVSRYPNTGYLTAKTIRGVKNYFDATNETWAADYWKNALAVVKSVNWIWDTRRITSNTSSRLYFDEIGNDYEKNSSPFLIRNHVRACDLNGEWAQQNDTLWICYTGDINQQKVEFPAIDTMIRIINCKYVRFSGISIERANMFTLHCKGSIITLENCNFSDSGGGLILATDNSSVNITGNTFKYGRRGGIYLENSHGTISKNKFKQFAFAGADNTERTYGASVANWYCDAKTIVSQNVFDSVNIAYNGHWSNADNYFTKNLITNYAMTIHDCGAVYIGSDWTDYKKYVTRNIIDYAVDDFSHGIYIDYNTHNVIADSNSISRSNSAIFVHVSEGNSIKYNNIVDPSIIMVDPWNSAVRFDEYDYNHGNTQVSPIKNNELLHNNIVLGTGTNESAVMYFNVTNCGSNKIDYNNYFDPFSSDPNIINNGKDYSSYWMYSLDEWKSFSGLDQNSTFNKTNWFYKSDLNIPKEKFVLLLTNPSDEEITYDLRYKAAEYIDINGNHYTRSIKIPAYYSVILFYYRAVEITNDAPVIGNQVFQIKQFSYAGGQVGKVIASDTDTDQKLTFSIISGNESNLFRIDPATGSIYFTSLPVDFSELRTYSIEVKVTDNGDPVLSSSATMTIDIIPENNAPVIGNQVFQVKQLNFSGNQIGKVLASDPDTDQDLTFSIISGNESDLFRIDPASGYLYFTNLPIDYSTTRTYIINVKVTDSGNPGLSNQAAITIVIIPDLDIIYIDPTQSNNSIEDGSILHPYNSWLDISFKEGSTYLQKAGTTQNLSNFDITANSVILGRYGEGLNPNLIFSTTDFGIRIFNNKNIEIKGVNFEAPNAVTCIYILGAESSNIEVTDCGFKNALSGIRADGDSISISYSDFSVKNTAIISYASSTRLFYNLFKDNLIGVEYMKTESTNDLFNNVFYGNATSVFSKSNNFILYNNIFYLYKQGDQAINAQLLPESSGNNLFYPDYIGFIMVSGVAITDLNQYKKLYHLESNSLSKDPLFKDPENNDFSVQEESPAIDAGKSVGLAYDYDGNSVPSGNSPDIGLHEIAKPLPDLPQFELYPNPSKGIVNILINNGEFNGGTLSLMSIDGVLINKFILPAGNQHTIDVRKSTGQQLASGTYMFIIETIGLKPFSQKIIIF